MELLADGVKIAETVLNEDNNWQYTFSDLPKYSGGVEIVYRVRETDLPGYRSETVRNEDGSFTVTNTNTETLAIPVTKRWVGAPGERITVHLYADGTEITSASFGEDEEWKHTFAGLLKYDGTDGHEIEYTVSENALPGYTASIEGDALRGFVITNTLIQPPSPPASPKTGDNAPLAQYLLTALFACCALTRALAASRKRKRSEQILPANRNTG